jgi:hypothetical protein
MEKLNEHKSPSANKRFAASEGAGSLNNNCEISPLAFRGKFSAPACGKLLVG